MIFYCAVCSATSIADQLLAVNQAKLDIKAAIASQINADPGNVLASYAALIDGLVLATDTATLSTGVAAENLIKGDIVTVINDGGTYKISKHSNPVDTDFPASTILFFGYTNLAGSTNDTIPITVLFYRASVAGDLD
jgi:hypothetical protein